jgi:hypothetical protein
MALQKSPTSLDFGTALAIAGSSPKHEVTIQSSFALSRAVTLDLTGHYVAGTSAFTIFASTADSLFAWRIASSSSLLQPFIPSAGMIPGQPLPYLGAHT